LEIAAALQIPYLRVFGDRIEGNREEEIEKILFALKKITKAAEKGGQTVLLEVHGGINSIETLEPILSEMQRFQNFGLIWDIAHSDKVYQENWLPFYEYIRPFIQHVHIKDHIREPLTLTDLGKGQIPIRAIVDRMLSDGYEGYFSLEWEKKWHPELSELEPALQDYKAIMLG
jgi:sugar phosphate isomerase/epimerase